MHPAFTAADTVVTVPLYLLTPADVGSVLARFGKSAEKLAAALQFRGERGDILALPTLLTDPAEGTSEAPALQAILLGVGGRTRPSTLNGLVSRLPPGNYSLAALPSTWPLAATLTAWAEAGYSFTRYKGTRKTISLVVPPQTEGAKAAIEIADSFARAGDLARDLVNTPPMHMGPVAIEQAARALSERFAASLSVITGATLLTENYPLIHAVGRAAVEAPRFIELTWQSARAPATAPTIALVGKGVSFDTGGLNLKPEAGMRIMKKDMGGAAHALALASLVMEADLPVRLVVAIAAVENAIGPDAFRPSDIIASRKGLSVEIENTDAEGRLILADALARACEHKPELLVNFATLTGAARTALGPDLPPFYTHSDTLAAALYAQAALHDDPVWRMPLWAGYTDQLKSPIADLKNLGDAGGMAGSVVAALFLEPFIDAPEWVHFDLYSWQTGANGRTAGAAFQAAKAVFGVLSERYPAPLPA